MPDSTLHAALIAARASIPAIPKTATNPHFGNRYAVLGDILAAVLPPLHANGLSLFASVNVEGAAPALIVQIVHAASGEYVASCVPLIGATDMQRLGGGMTYAMRYALGGLLALELDDDDDGNAASRPAAQAPHQAPTRAPAPTRSAGDESACPRCGVAGFIRRLKSGKDAGRWRCMDWPEKGMNGCGGTYNSDPRKAAPRAPVPSPEPADEPPNPTDDDLPF